MENNDKIKEFRDSIEKLVDRIDTLESYKRKLKEIDDEFTDNYGHVNWTKQFVNQEMVEMYKLNMQNRMKEIENEIIVVHDLIKTIKIDNL